MQFFKTMPKKYFLSWSGGKDCCLSLYKAAQLDLPVRLLLTSVNKVHQRISMHGVRVSLLEQQAALLQLSLHKVALPETPGMAEYENAMNEAFQQLKASGFTGAVFGDIFLDDLKQYRELQLAKQELSCFFPLWKRDSKELMTEFLSLGFKAIVVCINNQFLDRSFCGRLIDESFVNDLPAGVDVCGENGEYHSFVFDGPLFSKPVSFQKGQVVYREYAAPQNEKKDSFTTPGPPAGFYFCDLLTP